MYLLAPGGAHSYVTDEVPAFTGTATPFTGVMVTLAGAAGAGHFPDRPGGAAAAPAPATAPAGPPNGPDAALEGEEEEEEEEEEAGGAAVPPKAGRTREEEAGLSVEAAAMLPL